MRLYGTNVEALCAIVSLVSAILMTGEPQAAEDDQSVAVATGSTGGLYQPVGGALCKLINDSQDTHGVSCTIEISSGTIENLNDLRAQKVNLAFAQSNLQYDAFKGAGPFEDDGPFEALRSLFAIYVEQLTVVVRSDNNIDQFEDLKGKRLYMGSVGSGQRETMQALMNAYGWKADSVSDVSEFKAANEAQALCDNEFDAFAYTIGHPNALVKEVMSTCDAFLMPLEGPEIDKIVKAHTFFVASSIPGGTYLGQERDVPGLGLVATLVASSETNADVTYYVTKAFFDNLAQLRELSPIFSTLKEADMTKTGLTAPLHDGAARYFHEAGLM